MRMMNGLQFKSSTLCFTMKSKSKLWWEIRKERDLSKSNLISNYKKRDFEKIMRKVKTKCTKVSKINIWDYLLKEKERSKMKSREKLIRRRKVVTSSYTKKNIEKRLIKRTTSKMRLRWSKDSNKRWSRRDTCFKKKEDKKENIFKRCLLRMRSKNISL